METLAGYFSRSQGFRRLLPFLQTYFLVTKTVALKSVAHEYYFQNPKKLEQLDIAFAALYFEPLLEYISTGSAPGPWDTYFSYCSKPSGVPFVQMLLGINAHINGDLAYALSRVDYGEYKDFLIINHILEEQIPKVMSYLAFTEYDAMGLGGLVFKKFVLQEFNQIIVGWRQQAWSNAQTYSTLDELRRLTNIQAEDTALKLIEIFSDRYKLHKAPAKLDLLRNL